MMIFDRAPVSGVKISREGYLDAIARVARTGIQVYSGDELGLPPGEYRIYRPEDEVFSVASLETYAHKPITIEHVAQVDSGNYRDLAVGHTTGDVIRDGEWVRFGLRVTDKSAIDLIEDGKRELSVGYDASVIMEPGVAPSGEHYDGFMKSIVANHVAITDQARAGSMARIGDNTKPQTEDAVSTKPLVLGDATVQVAETDAPIIEQFIQTQANDAAAMLAEKDRMLAERDAEIARLRALVATDEQIAMLAEERAKLLAAARSSDPSYVADGKSNAQIKRDIVSASGRFNIADSTTEAYVDAAFDLLSSGSRLDPVASEMRDSTGGDPWARFIKKGE